MRAPCEYLVVADVAETRGRTLGSKIRGIAYHLPSQKLTNEQLSREFPDWSAQKIEAKTGIKQRSLAGEECFSSTLASRAAEDLFRSLEIDASYPDFLLVCTQSPDFLLPTTASLVHAELGMRRDAGATDMNLGCSGFVYGLGLSKGLIESGQVHSVLLVTADTYSKFLNSGDRSVRTIFGDGASATLVTSDSASGGLRGFRYGTDGSGADMLAVPNGGIRSSASNRPGLSASSRGLLDSDFDLYMDGPGIFKFTLEVVPETVSRVLEDCNLVPEDIDLFVFHQANMFMLEHLREKLRISETKFYVSLANTGNTVSSTIPIALKDAETEGVLRPGMTVMVVGFGVGLSWAGAIIDWR